MGDTAWTVAIFCDRKHYVDGRDFSQSEALRGYIETVQSPSYGQELHLTLVMWGTLWSAGSSSDSSDEAKCTIVAHDRGSIVARSLHDHGPIVPRSRLIYRIIESTITTQSPPSRITINTTIIPLNRTAID